MKAGVSTACLYPGLLEDSLTKLTSNGIDNIEIFINTNSELEDSFINKLNEILKRNNAHCHSLHPFTCSIEPLLFFSSYERRVKDGLEFYKKYFSAMNTLGAEIFIFHGNKFGVPLEPKLYFERY
jgi:sugar phosphate isomerase/epimerase